MQICPSRLDGAHPKCMEYFVPTMDCLVPPAEPRLPLFFARAEETTIANWSFCRNQILKSSFRHDCITGARN